MVIVSLINITVRQCSFLVGANAMVGSGFGLLSLVGVYVDGELHGVFVNGVFGDYLDGKYNLYVEKQGQADGIATMRDDYGFCVEDVK